MLIGGAMQIYFSKQACTTPVIAHPLSQILWLTGFVSFMWAVFTNLQREPEDHYEWEARMKKTFCEDEKT